MIAESPTSPRHRDRIAIDPISTDTIARLHDEAEKTGRSIAAIAADWMETYQPPARRVVAVVERAPDEDAWFVEPGLPRTGASRFPLNLLLLAAGHHPNARVHDAGPGRYELVEDTP